ncbi:hypothetical protein PAPYR_1445 [Paratrimastix pyriformis]|uniref:Uncharacterized protein n=1 Tax=Paratrimastix pyriformis TaxID=342808 RepID=A0ABQ8UTT5_9EUKA|nr:hypothetical protein PAPYR_1445 [Paratrimastix pyriformis]
MCQSVSLCDRRDLSVLTTADLPAPQELTPILSTSASVSLAASNPGSRPPSPPGSHQAKSSGGGALLPASTPLVTSAATDTVMTGLSTGARTVPMPPMAVLTPASFIPPPSPPLPRCASISLCNLVPPIHTGLIRILLF